MALSTAVAVVLTIASLSALAGGLGVALRDRQVRQMVAQHARSLPLTSIPGKLAEHGSNAPAVALTRTKILAFNESS
jgi:hypothetical protein